jgi:L-seryl-tRNA(Ser) seleniumtransferase
MNTKHVARAPLAVQLSNLPSVEKLLQADSVQNWIESFGRDEVLRAIRLALKQSRESMLASNGEKSEPSEIDHLGSVSQILIKRAKPNMRQVINLTGTVLHTNLGRAVMPPEVVQAIALAAAEPCALEYDLGEGKRGDRDELVEEMLCELTGAEAATVVNNNAAAVFLLLHALSMKKETVVSRGELVEIGGSFRIPDIMMRAGAKLVEIGTTNRTHAKDFEGAITPKTAMLMKVHTSNYAVQGFTASVPEDEIAKIAHAHNIPFVVDLGSGTLVDMGQFGLPVEPTPREAISNGADLVTFSSDKLLGGPQAGILVGRKDLIQKIKKNPLKRVLRVGKITLAGLESVLRLYRDPASLPKRLTVLQLLTRPAGEMQAQADKFIARLQTQVGGCGLSIAAKPVLSQIGSGSLPVERLPSVALAIEPLDKAGEKKVVRLERLLRSSETPVIGRFQEKALLLDLRCLQESKESVFEEIFSNALVRLNSK